MALEYVVTKRVFGFDKDKNEKYVAKSVRSFCKDMSQSKSALWCSSESGRFGSQWSGR